jgi:hypothetical protein
MHILPLAVGNMSIAYKITTYIIFTQEHASLTCKAQLEASRYNGRLLYLPNKRRQPHLFYIYFLLMFHNISTLQILFFPSESQIIY